MLLELSKKPFTHKSQQYFEAAQEFLDWLGDMAGEQDLDQWEKLGILSPALGFGVTVGQRVTGIV